MLYALMEYLVDILDLAVNHFSMYLLEIKQLESSQIAKEVILNTHLHLIKYHMITIVWEQLVDNAMSLSVTPTTIRQIKSQAQNKEHLIVLLKQQPM